jgi:hypothetical protein
MAHSIQGILLLNTELSGEDSWSSRKAELHVSRSTRRAIVVLTLLLQLK